MTFDLNQRRNLRSINRLVFCFDYRWSIAISVFGGDERMSLRQR